MAYFLSYIVLTEPGNRSGHASLCLVEFTPPPFDQPTSLPNPPRVLAKVGFWGASQVLEEDNYSRQKPGRRLFHKTYPVSAQQTQEFFRIVNADRRSRYQYGSLSSEQEEQIEAHNNILHQEKLRINGQQRVSIPKGPTYRVLWNNCKHYALNIMNQLGIRDPSIVNWGPQSPLLSGRMHPFMFRQEEESRAMLWEGPLELTELPYRQLAMVQQREGWTEAELTELQHIRQQRWPHYAINYAEQGALNDSAFATKQACKDECARYQQHLNGVFYKYFPQWEHAQELPGGFIDPQQIKDLTAQIDALPPDQITRGLIVLINKYQTIRSLARILEPEGNPSEQIAHFQYALLNSRAQNTLTSHRDAKGKRFLSVVLGILTGGIGLLIYAAYSKWGSGKNSFQFWKSHGEVTIDRLQENTAIHSAERVLVRI